MNATKGDIYWLAIVVFLYFGIAILITAAMINTHTDKVCTQQEATK